MSDPGKTVAKLLSVKEAAERLGVSPALIYELCAARKLRHERHGLRRGTIRIPEDALEDYRKRRTVAVEEEAEKDAHVTVPQPSRTKFKHLT